MRKKSDTTMMIQRISLGWPTGRSLARLFAMCCLTALSAASAVAQDDLSAKEEQAIQAAVARVAPSVVRIETLGGLETIGGLLVGTGPTTGLVVSTDGY